MPDAELPPAELFAISVVAGLVQGIVNIVLQHYASASKSEGGPSWLNRRQDGGIVGMEAWTYIVSGCCQGVILPAFWVAALCGRPAHWWFEGELDWPTLGFAGYGIGYYLQDTVLFFKGNSWLIFVHHVGTIVLIVCMVSAGGWRGCFLTVGFVYEVGSFGMGLVDLGLLPRTCGPVGMLITTLVGMGLIAHGCFVSPLWNGAAWSGIFLVLGAGVGRAQQSVAYLAEPKQEAAGCEPVPTDVELPATNGGQASSRDGLE